MPVPGVTVDYVPGFEARPIGLVWVIVLVDRRSQVVARTLRPEQRPRIRPDVGARERSEIPRPPELAVPKPALIPPRRINGVGRVVADIAFEVGVPCLERNRVFLHPASRS